MTITAKQTDKLGESIECGHMTATDEFSMIDSIRASGVLGVLERTVSPLDHLPFLSATYLLSPFHRMVPRMREGVAYQYPILGVPDTESRERGNLGG